VGIITRVRRKRRRKAPFDKTTSGRRQGERRSPQSVAPRFNPRALPNFILRAVKVNSRKCLGQNLIFARAGNKKYFAILLLLNWQAVKLPAGWYTLAAAISHISLSVPPGWDGERAKAAQDFSIMLLSQAAKIRPAEKCVGVKEREKKNLPFDVSHVGGRAII